MGSRALFIRSINCLLKESQQSRFLSSSSKLLKEAEGTSVLMELKDTVSKTPQEFFTSKELIEYEKKKKGYICIESEVNAVGIVSGVPEEHIKTRTVRIYKPAKNAMQSGTNNIDFWQICFDTRERWENPLMGWCSSGDPLQALRVEFSSVEEAVQHCKNMGWNYIIQKPNEDDPKPRSYGINFSWDKRTRVTTK